MQQMPQRETLNFRRNVGELCSARGEVQRTADAAGITRVYLSQVIHGHATPSMDVAARIAKALGIPLADLMESPAKLRKKLAAMP